MKRIAKTLQLAIIVKRSWTPPALETQLLEELDFLRRRVSAERTILEKRPEAGFLNGRSPGFLLDEFKPLEPSWSNASIQNDVQTECREIHVPRYDQRLEESDATLRRCIEDVCIQKFEDGHAHLFITLIAFPRTIRSQFSRASSSLAKVLTISRSF